MKDIYTSAEIAKITGKAKRTINLRAKADAWPFTTKKGVGGEVKYFNIKDLPEVIAAQLINADNSSDATDIKRFTVAVERLKVDAERKAQQTFQSRQNGLKQLAGLPTSEQESINERTTILDKAISYIKNSNTSQKNALKAFCDEFNAGTFSESLNVSMKSVSVPTIMRWKKAVSQHGPIGLLDKRGKSRKGRCVISSNSDLNEFCQAAILEWPSIKSVQLQKLLPVYLPDLPSIPSENTIRKWIRNWKDQNSALYMSIVDPAGFKNKKMSALGDKRAGIERVNQVWEFDSTPTDVMLTDGRYAIIAVIDVFTNRVKVVLWPSSAAMGVASLIRSALLEWGVPEIARTDNGADYVSNHISSVWDSLEIYNDVTAPHSPWLKPFIERFFRTFSHGMAELFDGYIGHNVSEREKINARLDFAQRLMKKRENGKDNEAIDIKLSAQQFEDKMNQWLEYDYHHTPAKGLKNKTPFQVYSSYTGSIKKVKDIRALDILLAPVSGNGIRQIQKDGIHVDSGVYIASEMGEFIGERVLCRWNPKDIGRISVFSTITAEYMFEAVNPDIVGQGVTHEIAMKAKRVQKDIIRAQKKQILEASKRFDLDDAAQKYLDYKQTQNSGLSTFPKGTEDFENDVTKSLANVDKEETEYSLEKIASFKKPAEEFKTPIWSGPIYESEHHKANHFSELKSKGNLEPLDTAWLHQYRRENPAAAAMLDKVFKPAAK